MKNGDGDDERRRARIGGLMGWRKRAWEENGDGLKLASAVLVMEHSRMRGT
jgi:hypothetical protein